LPEFAKKLIPMDYRAVEEVCVAVRKNQNVDLYTQNHSRYLGVANSHQYYLTNPEYKALIDTAIRLIREI